MRGTRFLALFTSVSLAALTVWTGVGPVSTGVSAQAPAPGGHGGRGGAPVGAPGAGRGRGRAPVLLRRPAGGAPLPSKKTEMGVPAAS